MIIAINNSDEKSLIVKYLNKVNGTNHPTTFFVNVGGYIAIDGNDFIHNTCLPLKDFTSVPQFGIKYLYFFIISCYNISRFFIFNWMFSLKRGVLWNNY